MPPLRRHQLAHLSSSGWRGILRQDWDGPAHACLQHWARQGLPLVVTRQRLLRPPPGEPVALGLAAPTLWGRRALRLQAPAAEIAWFSEFPMLAAVLDLLPRSSRASLQVLQHALQRAGVRAHAYGSFAWQQLSGLDYLHEHSDLDLWLAVDGVAQADAAVRALALHSRTPRLDGELMFPDGSAVAWREWAAWREGRCAQVLVKRLNRAVLVAHPEALASAWPCAA